MRLGWKKPMTQQAIEANRLNGKKGGRPKLPAWAKGRAINTKALKYCPEAIEILVHEMRHCDNPAVRVACARELLDRGVGKPSHSQVYDQHAGQMLNQIMVITGVPEPDPEEEEVLDEGPSEIDGEVVKNGHDA